MFSVWSDVPMITCPHCGKTFQLDDYYTLDVDDSFDCYECEKKIYILEKNITISFNLGTEEE